MVSTMYYFFTVIVFKELLLYLMNISTITKLFEFNFFIFEVVNLTIIKDQDFQQ
jgi:hypothetical protein